MLGKYWSPEVIRQIMFFLGQMRSPGIERVKGYTNSEYKSISLLNTPCDLRKHSVLSTVGTAATPFLLFHLINPSSVPPSPP